MLGRSLLVAAALLAASPSAARMVTLNGLPTPEIVTLLMREVLGAQFVIAPEVLADRRPASVAIRVGTGDDPAKVAAALKSLGLEMRRVGSVFHVGKAPPPSEVVSVAGGAENRPIVDQLLVYEPRHRTADYLASIVGTVIPDAVVVGRNADQAGPAVSGREAPTVLVVRHSQEQARQLVQLLEQIDSPVPQLRIRATVFEVASSDNRTRGFDLAVSILGGRFGLASGTGAADGETVARLNLGGFSAAVSALSQDGRFRAVSSPRVLTRSGAEAVLVSGSQVPVLGAVQLSQDGERAVQSVEYRDSGVVLRVKPVVMRGAIDLDVTQELSNFVQTSTSGIDSPTLNKRTLTNRLVAAPGDVFLLGGLTETRDGARRSRGLLGLPIRRTTEKSEAEVIMLLQVELAPSTRPERSDAAGEAQALEL